MKSYHENSLRILDEVQSALQGAAFEAQQKPKEELRPIARISSIQKPVNNVNISSPSEPRPMKPAGPAPPIKPVAAAAVSRPVPSAKGGCGAFKFSLIAFFVYD